MGHARAVVVGAGSIGLRHHRVLTGLGVETALVSRRAGTDAAGGVVPGSESVPVHPDLATAVHDNRPDHVVVATETSTHLSVLNTLAATGFTGSVVVEKPVTHRPSKVAADPFRTVAVGYQLRVHPAIEAARDLLSGVGVLSVNAHVGQHLAAWRPGRAVGASASARVEDGGGVLRDLSHELDLVTWLAGGWRRVCATGGRSGALGVDVATDDRWGILLELERGAVATLHLDALDHVGQRRLSIVGDRRSVAVDLIAGTVRLGTPSGSGRQSGDGQVGWVEEQHLPADRDQVLARLHCAVMEDPGDGSGAVGHTVCSLAQGMAVVGLIDAVERSVRTGGWVEREDLA